MSYLASTLTGPPASSAGTIGSRPALPLVEGFARALFAAFIFFACFTFLRPSPYDFAAIPAIAVWMLLGIRLHRSSVVFVTLLVVLQVSMLVCLIPYLGEENPRTYTIQSVYLTISAIFFTMFFSDDTFRRSELALKAYFASCLFAAAAGCLAYSVETGILFTKDGRAAGVFEDPNVLGSFLILGLLYCLRDLLTGETRHPLFRIGSIALILSGIFLSFSRGSWGATVGSVAMLIWLTWRSHGPAVRSRIRIFVVLGLAAIALVGTMVAATTDVSDRFEDRAQITKDYDEGETGRFGNQLRSLPMLLERPEGFGPLRFRLVFGLEPHNSYIGNFANAGWIGGFAFIVIVLTTTFVGLRLCLSPSPYQRLAHMVVPVTLTFFLQGMQIDVDHWRHVHMLLGFVWGLEAARCAWRRKGTLPSLAGSTGTPARR